MVINPIRSLRVTRMEPPSSCFAGERVSREKGQPIATVSLSLPEPVFKNLRTAYITCRGSHQPRPFRAIDFSPQSHCSHFCISALSTFRGSPHNTSRCHCQGSDQGQVLICTQTHTHRQMTCTHRHNHTPLHHPYAAPHTSTFPSLSDSKHPSLKPLF